MLISVSRILCSLQKSGYCRVVWPRDLCYVRYWRRNDDGSYGKHLVCNFVSSLQLFCSKPNRVSFLLLSSCVVSFQGA